MRILRRAGYRRRTPHKKSASGEDADTDPGAQSAHGPARAAPPRHRRPPGSTAPPRHGTCTDPPLQVHHLAPGTVLIRQSKDLTFEAPFILLLLGERSRPAARHRRGRRHDAARVVDDLVADWLLDADVTGLDAYDLVVAHTHGHGDHVAGDAAFADRPHTTVVGHDVDGGARPLRHHRLARPRSSPSTSAAAPLEVFGIPGHHAASIAVHDARTGLLHTGDTVYPGRIYVDDPPALLDTLDRLVTFADDRDVRTSSAATSR